MSFPNISVPSTPATIPGVELHHSPGPGFLNAFASPYGIKDKANIRARYSIQTTAGSTTITNTVEGFAGAAIGQKIWIRWGGSGSGIDRRCFISTITGVGTGATPTTITVADAVTQSLSGAYGKYGSDCKAEVYAFLQECATRGMHAYFPQGRALDGEPLGYGFWGSRLRSDGRGDPNAMIPLWFPDDFNRRGHLIIQGEGAISPEVCFHTNDVVPPTNGTQFNDFGTNNDQTATITGGIPLQCSIFGTSETPQPTWWGVTFNNITLLSRPNPDGRGLNVGGINPFRMAAVQFNNCLFVGDSSIYAMPEPLDRTVGFQSVENQRETCSYMSNCQVWNAHTGFQLQEHVRVDNISSNGNIVGIAAGYGNQSWSAGKINIHWTKYGVQPYGNSSNFRIEHLNVEDLHQAGTDYGLNTHIGNVATIHDPSGFMRGTIRISPSFINFNSGVPYIVGAANLNITNMNDVRPGSWVSH